MAFDMTNFVIDRVIRGVMLNPTDNSVRWALTQIEEPNLSVTTTTQDVVDAIGSVITTYERGKAAEFTGTNSILDLDLLAAQSGVDKKIASSGAAIEADIFDEFKKPVSGTTITLKKTPIGTGADGLKYIYKMSGTGVFTTRYEYATEASATEFTYTGTTLTLPTDATLAAGDTLMAIYSYLADGSEGNGLVSVDSTANDFPVAGKFIMEVLGSDVCDTSTLVYAYVIFPNAKLASDYDLSFTPDGKHPFTIRAAQDYCDNEKRLFRVMIPEV